MKHTNKAICVLILLFFIPIIYFLYLHSMIGTSVLNQFSEESYYVKDVWWVHLIVFVFLMAVGIGLHFTFEKLKLSEKLVDRALMVFAILYFVLLSVYVWSVKWFPQGDQLQVYEAAFQLISGDYSKWGFGGYLAEWPNQTGLVLIYTFFAFIFGENAYLWIQQWNVICYVLSAILIYKITIQLFGSKLTATCSYLLFLLFLPFAGYTTFVYGTVPGFAASMAAFYFLLVFMKDNRIQWLVFSGVLITLAYLYKNNYLITFVALLFLLLAGMIVEKKWKSYLAGMGILVGSLLLGIFLSHMCIKATTGTEVAKGVPAWNYIAMGMQEGSRAPGWYNSYNILSYRESGWDPGLSAENSQSYIKRRIGEFMDQPAYFVEFYSKKIVSQWNNPTFQGFWIQQIMSDYREDVPDTVDAWIQDEGVGKRALVNIFNVFQSIVLLGCILFVFTHKKPDFKVLSLAVIMIGGFLFHVLWEAKAQYTVCYFVLLIPYAVQGMISLGEWILSDFHRISRRKVVAVIVTLGLTLIVISQRGLLFQKAFHYYNDNAVYQEYLADR